MDLWTWHLSKQESIWHLEDGHQVLGLSLSRTLLAKGIATRSKKLLVTPGITTRNKDATRNKGITTRSK